MTPQILRILKKLYKFDNVAYDIARSVSLYSDSVLSDNEKNLLSDYGWKNNEIVSFANHDDVLAKLASLKKETALTEKRCIDSFVAGVGGSYLRGRSALAAWQFLSALPVHAYDERRYACCWICEGYDKPENINDSYFQYCLYLGHAYSSSPVYAYLNLRHLLSVPPVVPTADDCRVLAKLLDLLRTAPDGETPGKFEKRLAEAKILSGDRYNKRGVLNSLAKAGVIPNRFVKLSYKSWTPYGEVAAFGSNLKNMSGRSDMEMPWAGWLGSLKIDEEKARELFGG